MVKTLLCGCGIMNQTRHVLGITTYRENKSENIDLVAWKLFKDNQKRAASKHIAETINKKLLKKFEHVRIIGCNPAIGVFEGGTEPSAIPVFYAESDIWNKNEYNYRLLDMFKRYTMQDSILLYEIVKKGHPGIKIKIPYKKLNVLQLSLLRCTDDKIGGYLTYDYVTKTVTILNIKEFDGLTDKKFISKVDHVKTLIRELGGTLTVFNHHYKIV